MANLKISELPQLAGADLVEDDLLCIVDVGASATMKLEYGELFYNVRVGGGNVGTGGIGVLAITNATLPSTSPNDAIQLVSSDYAAGDARLLLLSESGTNLWLGNGTLEAKAPASGAGNNLTLKASAAASGNTNGGNLIAQLAAKAGSGVDGTFVVKAATASPGANLQEWQSSSGTSLLQITSVGDISRQDGTNLTIRSAGSTDYYVSNTHIFRMNVNYFSAMDSLRSLGQTTVPWANLYASAVAAGTPASGAGNNLTIQGSAAASGNTNGGNLIAQLAAKAGSGTDGVFVVKAATASPGANLLEFHSSAPAVLSCVTAAGWIQNTPGLKRVATDVTNVGTTMATITGLSATLVAGRTYSFHLVVMCEDVTAADGVKIDFNGGDATVTDFETFGTIDDTTLGRLATVSTTTLDGDIAVTAATGPTCVEVKGTITVDAAGTFIVRGAKNDDAAGATITFKRGSFLWIQDMP